MKDGKEFTHVFPKDDKEVNTATILRVPDVYRPYMVLDDLSYRITKDKNPSNENAARRAMRMSYLEGLTAGDVRIGEEMNLLGALANNPNPMLKSGGSSV